ncbi:RHS repeat-associated core domain-containing protein [Streptomyces cacaoi]|uniref:RHS repeat-associated core domain-containing protein n=1 Tax=Streptomyces cacaoi TaxID=1898 RepID=UPI00374924BB
MGYTVPDGVDTMLDVVGVGWPNIDEDAYRDMADALREFAEDADEDRHQAHQHIQRLISSGKSEALDALDMHWTKVGGKYRDLGKAARLIAGALDAVADIIVARKAAAVAELADLCATIGITLALAPVTSGLSTLLAAGKVAATRAAFKRILKEMAEAAVEEVVAILTEPAVAALENVVADLALGVVTDVAGVPEGSEGNPRLDSSSGGMQLASAGGAKKDEGLSLDHDEHNRAGIRLSGVQTSMRNKTSGKLGKAKRHHSRAKGKDALTATLDTTLDGVTEKLGTALDDLGDHVGSKLTKRIKDISDGHRRNDHRTKDDFDKLKAGRERSGEGRRGGVGRGPGVEGKPGPKSLREVPGEARKKGISLSKRECETDPIDVASGEMVLRHVDVDLPGVLPLVLSRTHISSYRYGFCYGVSWASTLDERLELTNTGAVWAREDGSLLVYPSLPREPGDEVWPVEGARLPLTLVSRGELGDVTYAVAEARAGRTRYFVGSPYRGTQYWLSEIEDRNGNSIAFERDPNGLPVAVVHGGGYHVRVANAAARGRVEGLALETPEGAVPMVEYGFDDDGHLETVTNSSGIPLRFTYDRDARITSWTDRNGSIYQYVYDGAGRVVRTLGPSGFLSSSFRYEPAGSDGRRITRFTNSLGHTTTFHVNQHWQVVQETDPLGNATAFERDRWDNLLAITDALGRITCFERDEHGNILSVTAPDGVRTYATYNHLHLPVEIVERGGRRVRYDYDEFGNLVSATDPAGAVTEYQVGPRGHVSSIRHALGGITRITTDPAGLPLAVTNPSGATTTCSRDAFGRITSAIDALGERVRQAWTVEGKPSWRELPDGAREEWTWDGEGNLVSHTDRMGRTRFQPVTHFDLPKATQTEGAESAEFRFTHDTELRLTKVTNAQGLEWHYVYDAAGRLTSETDFDGRTLTYEHDAIGRLVRRTNAVGQSLTFERDVLGRVTRIRHDDGAVSTFDYDATGDVNRMVNDHTAIDLERDPAGRVVAETVNGRTLTRTYDAVGRCTQRRTPSGATSTLLHDEAGLAAYALGEHIFHFEHDALGRETGRSLDGRLTLAHTWDVLGRLAHQSVTTPADSVLARTFTYQADGAPLGIDDSHAGQRCFELDTRSRITVVRARGWTETYSYTSSGDQAHTRLPERAPGQNSVGQRAYEGIRPTRAGRTRYQYDGQGRLICRTITTLSGKKQIWRFRWDAEDRLTHVEAPSGELWRYHYDALGRRTSKQRLSGDGQILETTTYCWDGGQLAEQQTAHTTLVWDHIGLRPLAQREMKVDSAQREVDRRFFAIVTHLDGSPSELVDPDGYIAWRARSTAWGATQWNRDCTAYTPLRYPGQYFDPETGFHYNVNRYYDPDLGRYVTPDPLGLAPSPNPYAYVPNPFVLADPLGLAGCSNDPTWGGRVRFTRDRHGRPYEMNAIVTRDMLDEGTRANNSLTPPGYLGDGRRYNQARGHMLARMLGGSGDTLDNLFTITQSRTNTPEMSTLEQAVYDAVSEGKVVTYNVYLEYADELADSAPKWIQLEAFDQHGNRLFDDILGNPAYEQQQRHRRGLL